MAIGIDGNENFEDELEELNNENNQEPGNQDQGQDGDPEPQSKEEPSEPSNEDFLDYLLKSRGIVDKSKISFENEDQSIEEKDWDTLSNEEKLNILNSTSGSAEDGLDDSEIQLINAIRSSGLTPQDYIQYVQKQGVDLYVQNTQQPSYAVDDYSDDELFVADLLSKTEDITEEEAQEALERAKSNETLYKKQIDAIRKEYKTIEEDNLKQQQYEQEQQQQYEFDQFAQNVTNQINALQEYGGYDLNLEESDMQELYDFITGTDAAGNNHFAKALSDPKTLVQVAWLALNGEQMMRDITSYFQKEISNVRQESYKKGKEDAVKETKPQSKVVFNANNNSKVQDYFDLDDF